MRQVKKEAIMLTEDPAERLWENGENTHLRVIACKGKTAGVFIHQILAVID